MSTAGKPPLRRRFTAPVFDPDISGSELQEQDGDDDDVVAAPQTNWAATLIAGGVAGGASRSAVAPLERIKILFQVQGISAGPKPVLHTSVWESLRSLAQRDGIKGLWKGNGLNCVRVVPSSAIQFGAYALYKQLLFGAHTNQALPTYQLMVAGGLAGATSTVMTYPIDLVRARRTVDFRSAVPQSLVNSWVDIGRAVGARGLYRGVLPSLCGIVPYKAVDFAIFDILKRRCRHYGIGLDEQGDVRPLTKVCLGAAAGVCGMTVAFPFDTVRRNLQVATLKVRHEEKLETTMSGSLRAITLNWTRPLNLYRGLWPNYLKAAPSVGISFATFEAVRDVLDEKFAD
jgi:solute carrier family 25 phosphate transporter 23/24/25/41